MKLQKEYTLILIIGLFILAYVLDAVVNPLDVTIPSPYHYLQPSVMSRYPFSTASLFIKSIALFLTPVLLLSFIQKQYVGKAIFTLVIAGLLQLFAIQDIVTRSEVVPLEWSLSMAVTGLGLLALTVIYFIIGIIDALKQNIGNAKMEVAIERLKQEEQNNE